MRIVSSILCAVAIVVSKACCHANDVPEPKLDVLLTIDQDGLFIEDEPVIYLYSNDKGEVVWGVVNTTVKSQGMRDHYYSSIEFCGEITYGIMDCYYSSVDLLGEKIHLTKVITDALIQLRFTPIWSTILEESSFKQVWGSEYFANYNIVPIFGGWGAVNPKCMDDFGNVLVSFSHDGPKDHSNKNPNKLGVWHKDRGFKFLPIPGIGSVKRVFLESNRLIVLGLDETLTIERFVVLSIADGFWGERKQENVVPESVEPKPESDSWWPSWWD
ncbi:MAG TPA: hypothetical protein VIH61_06235 [Waddliaceae bacterium]